MPSASVVNKKIGFCRIFPGLLIIGIVFISGCVQEKESTPEPNPPATVATTAQPSATSTAEAIQVGGKNPQTLDNNNNEYLPLTYNPVMNTAVAVLVEDTDFKFSNKCEIRKIPGASNGSLLACIKAGGEKINVTFTGAAASLIYLGSPNGGIVKVQIDGKEYPEINTVVSEETVPWTLESGLMVIERIASNLQNTNHILTFEIENKSTAPSGKTNGAGDIYIDAIEIKNE